MIVLWPIALAWRRLVFVIIFILTATSMLASSQIASAANISAVDSKDGKTRIDLVGEIVPGAATLKAAKKANNANRLVVISAK